MVKILTRIVKIVTIIKIITRISLRSSSFLGSSFFGWCFVGLSSYLGHLNFLGHFPFFGSLNCRGHLYCQDGSWPNHKMHIYANIAMLCSSSIPVQSNLNWDLALNLVITTPTPTPPHTHPPGKVEIQQLVDYWNLVCKLYSTKLGQLANHQLYSYH